MKKPEVFCFQGGLKETRNVLITTPRAHWDYIGGYDLLQSRIIYTVKNSVFRTNLYKIKLSFFSEEATVKNGHRVVSIKGKCLIIIHPHNEFEQATK